MVFKQLTLQKKEGDPPTEPKRWFIQSQINHTFANKVLNRTRIKSHRLPARLKGDAFYFDVYKGLIAHQYVSIT